MTDITAPTGPDETLGRIRSVADVIRLRGAERPDAPMLTLGDARVTYGQMLTRAGQVATGLADLGVGRGDRVAFLDKNSIEYFEVLFGGALAGAVNVAVNWRLAPPEMAYVVNDAEAKVLVAHQDFAEHLAGFRDQLTHTDTVVLIGGDGSVPDVVDYHAWVDAHPSTDPGVVTEPDDVALQLYTSGTTGHPKGAQLTNANYHALVEAAASWAMSPASVSLVAMPLFHIGGSGWALFGMTNGCHSVLMRDIDPVAMLGLIRQHRVTHAFLVPAVLQFLLMVPHDDIDLSSMELIAYGASPISEDILVKSMQMFGCDFVQVYGLTETTGAVVQLDPEDHDPGGERAQLLRAAGRAMPGVELRIADPDTGQALPDGEVGEVWIRTAQNMAGYWKLPDATAAVFPGDGWFRSGDAGYLRDGYLFIHDRVKDMIISGGENIYPAEIENALMHHPAVADVAVIGVPDDKWGETPKAIVVKSQAAEGDDEQVAAAIIEHARANLARYKCPSSVDFVEAIPRNPSGKVLKRELREPYWADRDRQV